MKTLSQILTNVCILAFFASVLFAIFYSLYKWGKNNARLAKEYDEQYDRVRMLLDFCEPNANNYNIIFKELKILAGLKYKNRERTHVIGNEFASKYSQFKEHKVAEVRNNV